MVFPIPGKASLSGATIMISLVLLIFMFVASTHGMRIVCYYSNMAQYRGQLGMFKPENVDPILCTHLVYSYARVYELSLQPTEWNDDNSETGEGMYSKILRLRTINSNLKVLLSVGDIMRSPDPYLPALQNVLSREAFAIKIVEYLDNRTFDGIVLEWATLGGKRNPRFDSARFLWLLKAIREKFDILAESTRKESMILSITLPAKKHEIDSFPIKEMVEVVDFINIKAFDLITAEDKVVGLSSPFVADQNAWGDARYLSFKWAAEYYLFLKIPKNKINLGISTFGRSFTLRDEKKNVIGSPASDFGNIGPWSATVGILGHYEVCQYIWSRGSVYNVPSQGGRYYVSGNTWVSYEDTLSITQKSCYAMDKGYGGLTFWTLDLDDFSGNGCREGRYPIIGTAVYLTTAASRQICNVLNSTDYVEALSKDKMDIVKPVKSSVGGDKLRVICYYASWAFFRRGKALFVPESIDPNICTHIIYAYAVIQNLKVVPLIRREKSEPWQEGLFDRFAKNKEINPNLKVMISIGGGAGENFIETLPSDSGSLKTMATNVVSFFREKDFDGLEVTWELPSIEHKQGYMDLLKAMKTAFDEDEKVTGMSQLILTVALPAGKAKIDVFSVADLKVIEGLVDFISIRTYDFHGSWEKHTGFNSPLYGDLYETGDNVYLNVHWVINYVASLGVSRANLNIGIPTYGRSFTLQSPENNEVYSATTGPGMAGPFTGIPGFMAYYEVCDLLTHGSKFVHVASQKAVYAYQDKLWVGFETIDSVAEKACYAHDLGYGGVNIWSLDTDDFTGVSCEQGKYPLVTTIYNITQNIDTSMCSDMGIMASISGAERELPGLHLMCLSLMASLIIGFQQTRP